MTGRFGRAVAVLVLVALAQASVAGAQLPQPPAGGGGRGSAGEDATTIFNRAVGAQLAAEKSGGDEARAILQRVVADYRRVLVLKPDATPAEYNLGRALRSLGDTAGAAKHFETAASKPGSQRVFYLRQWADFLRDEGRRNDACRAYEEVVILEPQLDKPHEFVRDYYFELRDRAPLRMVEYVWRLVGGRQAERAADLAVDALDGGWPAEYRAELLAATVASVAQLHLSPAEILGLEIVQRLRGFDGDPAIGRGVGELYRLYESPGRYSEPFRWWSTPRDRWAEARGVSRQAAFGAAMRAVGDLYREKGETEIATSCFRAALELGEDPDPVALRRLANIYVETNDLPALDRLSTEYADPSGRLFEAKGRAYAAGELDRILDYHRALGQIYGSLAASGKASWGSSNQAGSALFQLERAFEVAQEIDRRDPPADGSKATRLDPDLTVLYSRGLEATGDAKRSVDVRIQAAEKFEKAGNSPATSKVLQGVATEKLTPVQLRDVEKYRKVEMKPPVP